MVLFCNNSAVAAGAVGGEAPDPNNSFRDFLSLYKKDALVDT